MRSPWALIAMSVLALIAGGVVIWGAGAAQQVLAKGRADLPGDVYLDAEDTGYDVILSRTTIQTARKPEDLVVYVECTVDQPSGRIKFIRGSRQGVATTTDFGSTIGRFHVKPGPTRVACRWRNASIDRQYDNQFLVARRGTAVHYVAYGLFAIAFVLGGAGLYRFRRSLGDSISHP